MIIFPTMTEESIRGEEIYKISHGNYAPGEQKSRDYKWYVDPNSTRFGVKGGTIAFNGVSTAIAEVLKGSVGEENALLNQKKVSFN